MKGLITEAEAFLKDDAEKAVRDAGLIADAQRVEHYEISGYGTVVRYAKELGYDSIARKLQKTLDEEYRADEKLDKLAENRLNKRRNRSFNKLAKPSLPEGFLCLRSLR